ncbi:ABC transporter permease [Streptomyces sp. P1-3]|uniref:ABC transporter permease n=1 Tax=Streptomyces sp. P1-3 TaxID=3421658 RepID=UPI003D35D1CF
MSTMAASLEDFSTMLQRNFRHTLRNPTALFNAVLFPIIMMLMFVHVFGGSFDVGDVDYIDYATPGVIMMTIGYGVSATAVAVNSDMSTGIINRFRVMDVSPTSVLTAHVIASMLRSLASITFIVLIALAMGFRPDASPLQWLGVLGVILLALFAIGWLTVALGLGAKTPENAGFAVVPLMMLPFLSNAFVETDNMGGGARQFAEYQPFSPITETLRGLFAGDPSASPAIQAVIWCVGLALLGFLLARSNFTKRA